jgi:Fe-S-cluster containining protein
VSEKVLCSRCNGLCCRYFALPVDKPKTEADYDDIRWFLAHKGISVFVEDGDWYVNVKNKCRHLCDTKNKCRIYEKRPRICRRYNVKDCDLTEGDYDYKLHFTDDKQMEEYIKVKFRNNRTEKRKPRKLKLKRKK